jgi:hypothetical protein
MFEQNDLITRTGPTTPMGALFRRYWTPALLAEELPQTNCPPVRVKRLSERLVAFRDSAGRYGLIDEFYLHRGVSLRFGRNEEAVLICGPNSSTRSGNAPAPSALQRTCADRCCVGLLSRSARLPPSVPARTR